MQWNLTQQISDELLAALGECVARTTGLNFPPSRWRDLQRGIAAAAAESNEEDLEGFVRRLLRTSRNASAMELFGKHLTTNETYFLREPTALDALKNKILPPLLRSRRESERRLRIWCAGCASGEEAYSIAILLREILPDIDNWQISIVATDIDTRMLDKARQGRYSKWSFRQTPAWFQKKYFRKVNGQEYQIISDICDMVKFSFLNLALPVFPSSTAKTRDVDVLFCRNVLMYFTKEARLEILERFYRCLSNGGWLALSASENFQDLPEQFRPVTLAGATFYQKRENVIRKSLSSADDIHRRRTETAHPSQNPAADRIRRRNRGKHAVPDAAETVTSQTTIVDRKYAQALDCFEKGEYSQAAGMLRDLVGQKPGTVTKRNMQQIVRLLAHCTANLGETESARRWCERAIAANKTDPFSHYLMAIICREQGDFRAARKSLQKVLFLEPDFVMGYVTLGFIARSEMKIHEFVKHFEIALSLLQGLSFEAAVPGAEKMNAGQLREMITSQLAGQILAGF